MPILSTLVTLVLLSNCVSTIQYTDKFCSDDVSVRRESVVALIMMGKKAKGAVNDLIVLADRDPDAEVRRLAVEALVAIQQKYTVELNDVFIRALNDKDLHIRRAAVITIGGFDNFPPNVITTMQRHLTDPDRLVRELIMSNFERMGKIGVHDLMRGLDHADTQMRITATATLGRIGEDAKAAINKLKRVKDNDPDPQVRDAALKALRVISP